MDNTNPERQPSIVLLGNRCSFERGRDFLIWDSNDHGNCRVVDYSGWKYLENYGTFEFRSGVYIFANVDLQVKYIGMAGAGRIVDEINSALKRGKDYGANISKSALPILQTTLQVLRKH